MTHVVRMARLTLPTILIVWLAALPMLDTPEAGSVDTVMARTPSAHHGDDAAGGCCGSERPCCAKSGGCGTSQGRTCPRPDPCGCRIIVGSPLLFIGSELRLTEPLCCDRLGPTPEPAALVNIFQPPTPPPRPA